MDVRTEQGKGKLLFRWEPIKNVISIVCQNTVYDIRLLRNEEGGSYEVIDVHDKHQIKPTTVAPTMK